MKIELTLKTPAKNKGGDRYEGDCQGENLVVYFPQSLTRQSGSPAKDARLDIVNLSLFLAEMKRPRLVSRETFVEAVTPQFADVEGVVPGVGRFDPCPWGLGPEIRGGKSPHWTSPRNSAATYGHFGGSGTFVWVDPIADVACGVLTGREFDEWALTHWPDFSTAVLDELRR